MAHARPFWTSTLQDLSNGINNTSMWGVLTPSIELWVFGSPEGLQTPIFGSVSGDLTLPSKWGCDIRARHETTPMIIFPNPNLPSHIVIGARSLGQKHGLLSIMVLHFTSMHISRLHYFWRLWRPHLFLPWVFKQGKHETYLHLVYEWHPSWGWIGELLNLLQTLEHVDGLW